MLDAVVVGSGPNGLTAAVVLARAGLSVRVLESSPTIGGGTRTQELTRPGFLHDVCAAFHPLGAVSPALADLPLGQHGLDWIVPDVQVAHPFDDGTAAAAYLSIDETADGLGRDGRRWRRMVRPVTDRWDETHRMLLGPKTRPPSFAEATALAPLLMPAAATARRFGRDGAGLFTGIAAHSAARLTGLTTAGPGVVLAGLAHRGGWPLARGGTASITSALASHLAELGGEIETDRRIGSRSDLPEHRVALFATAPHVLAEVYDAPNAMKRWIQRYRYGPASYKVDFATNAPVPWKAEAARRAGTVHVGGEAAEIIRAEAQVVGGQVPDKPFVLVGQQSLFDPSRAPQGSHTVWAYTHVPARYQGSVVTAIESQIERFAPGFRDTIIDKHVTSPSALEIYNESYVGGDIGTGAMSLRQAIARPRWTARPYHTSIPGVYLCSAATPPGPGVHGMAGFHAANSALRDHFEMSPPTT